MASAIIASLMTFKYIMQCKDTDVDIQEYITRLQNCILEISNWMMVWFWFDLTLFSKINTCITDNDVTYIIMPMIAQESS